MATCSVMTDPAIRTVRLGGNVVASAVPAVRAALLPLIVEGATVTIDCTEVAYVDSMGIGVLIATYNSLSKVHGTLVLTSVSPELRELLHLMRLDQRFHLDESVEVSS